MNRMSTQKAIAGRFSAAAGTYNRHATIQSRVASGLINFTGRKCKPSAILEIGCGTGILTTRLLTTFPGATIHATDISEGMIREAEKRTATSKRVKWLAGDFRDMKTPAKFDLVVSSSTLHWITPLKKTFRKAGNLMRKDGVIAFSMMLNGTLAELHATRAKIAPGKKAAMQLPACREVLALLKQRGFRKIRHRLTTYICRFPSASRLLKSLHEQGVTSGPFASGAMPLNRSELERLVSHYDKHYKCRGGVSATYKVLYVVAEKKGIS